MFLFLFIYTCILICTHTNVCVFVHIHLYSSMSLSPSILVSLLRPYSGSLPHGFFLYLCICDMCTLVFSYPYNLIHSVSSLLSFTILLISDTALPSLYVQLMVKTPSWTWERWRVYRKQRREAVNGKLMGFGAYRQRLAAIASARLARLARLAAAEAEAEAKAAAGVDQTLNTAIKDLMQCILSEGICTEP